MDSDLGATPLLFQHITVIPHVGLEGTHHLRWLKHTEISGRHICNAIAVNVSEVQIHAHSFTRPLHAIETYCSLFKSLDNAPELDGTNCFRIPYRTRHISSTQRTPLILSLIQCQHTSFCRLTLADRARSRSSNLRNPCSSCFREKEAVLCFPLACVD